MMVASKIQLEAYNLTLAEEPVRPVLGFSDPWTTPLIRFRYFIGNLRRSLFRVLRSSSARRDPEIAEKRVKSSYRSSRS